MGSTVLSFQEFDKQGNLIKECYMNSDTSYFEYDAFSYKVKEIYSGETSIIKYKRDNFNKVIETLKINKGDSSYVFTNYDKYGNITKVYGLTHTYTECYYDSIGRIIKANDYREGYKSNEITYQYIEDTIIIEECPYKENGIRYPWSCSVTKAIYNDHGTRTWMQSTEYTPEEEYIEIELYTYNNLGQIKSIINKTNDFSIIYSYDNSSFTNEIKFYHGVDLKRLIKLKYKEN
jgi:hypothetical protein